MFDLAVAAPLMELLGECRLAHPQHYIRLAAFDSTRGWESIRASFIVNRPEHEPGFQLERAQGPGRQVHYSLRSYAVDRPAGSRYP